MFGPRRGGSGGASCPYGHNALTRSEGRVRAWAPSQSPASGGRRNQVRSAIAIVAWLLVVVAASPASAASPDSSPPSEPGYAPRFTHVMVVVMENQSLED